MGNCATGQSKEKNRPKIDSLSPANFDQAPEQPLEPKTVTKSQKKYRQSLKVKIPKKIERQNSDPYVEDFVYEVQHEDDLHEFRIQIKRSVEMDEQCFVWEKDSSICMSEGVNQEEAVGYAMSGFRQPIILDMQEILVNALHLAALVDQEIIRKKTMPTQAEDLKEQKEKEEGIVSN